MSAQIIPITSRQEAAWQHYVAAAAKAQSTHDINDGIAAGRAWRQWLELFMTDDQRKNLGMAR